MRHSILFPQTFLSLDSVQLGRLVLDMKDPQTDYLDLGEVPPQFKTTKLHSQYNGQETSAVTNSFSGSLAHLLSLERSKKVGTSTYITTDRVVTYQMKNSGQWFQVAVQDEGRRKWIEEARRRNGDIYFVTGYHTLLNARVYEGGNYEHGTSGQIALPVAEALTATGVVVPFGEVIDPSVSVTHQRQQAGRQVFVADGEQVVAVQYRKVQFKWYSSRRLHDKPLGPNQWEAFWTFRNNTDDDDQQDSVVEVDLQDELELEDDQTISEIEGEAFSLPDEE